MATLMSSNKDKPEVTPGLLRRRIFERDLFLTGNYGDLTTLKVWAKGDPRDKKNPPQSYTIQPTDFTDASVPR
jgi:hypothetical protein